MKFLPRLKFLYFWEAGANIVYGTILYPIIFSWYHVALHQDSRALNTEKGLVNAGKITACAESAYYVSEVRSLPDTFKFVQQVAVGDG